MNGDDLATAEEQPALLWTREEISGLASRSGNPSETLTSIVHLVHRQFATDVCSVYRLRPAHR